MWRRLAEPPKRKVRGFLAEGDEGIEGYAYAYEIEGESFHAYELVLTDFCAVSTRAAGRLLRFLGDHASLAAKVTWNGNPADPFLSLLAEQTYEHRVFFLWMIRIVDVVRALEGRGYPEGLRGEVHFSIEDPVVGANDGRFVLEVEGGHGRVRSGGRGTVETGSRGLAAIFTGFTSPRDARIAGLVQGTERELDAAGALFAGPSPWMPDMF
jgi:predicted acetyltransferase